jgi:hypothetical protein
MFIGGRQGQRTRASTPSSGAQAPASPIQIRQCWRRMNQQQRRILTAHRPRGIATFNPAAASPVLPATTAASTVLALTPCVDVKFYCNSNNNGTTTTTTPTMAPATQTTNSATKRPVLSGGGEKAPWMFIGGRQGQRTRGGCEWHCPICRPTTLFSPMAPAE